MLEDCAKELRMQVIFPSKLNTFYAKTQLPGRQQGTKVIIDEGLH